MPSGSIASQLMPADGRAAIRWARRVPQSKICRLYESEARGLLDQELLDDVALMLYLRCQDILTILEAKRGRVACPRCRERGVETLISRTRRRGDPCDETVRCPVCGWAITWSEYALSHKRKQLNSGGAASAFGVYLRRYERVRSPRELMLAVDALIHAFHFSLRRDPEQPTRAAGVNLIEGKLDQVNALLDGLTYGSDASPTLLEAQAEWRRNEQARQRWLDSPSES
jgi:DNA-directed RNA polymerase subunit M/transcription elongation factor TFIIS